MKICPPRNFGLATPLPESATTIHDDVIVAVRKRENLAWKTKLEVQGRSCWQELVMKWSNSEIVIF